MEVNMGKFSEDTLDKAWERQGGKCAKCGKLLVKGNTKPGQKGAWHPHHRASQDKRGTETLRNCVIFCINPEGGCHLKVGHGGDWRKHPSLNDKELPCLYAGEHRKKKHS
jgi:hypothetical protein